MKIRRVCASAVFGCVFAACAFPEPFTDAELAPGAFDAACDRRTEDWRKWISAYRPDYSDSSHMLLPPEGNRLEKPFALVKGGKAVCQIAVSGEETRPCIAQAVADFNRYVKEITGVELPVATTWNVKPGMNTVFVGKRMVPRDPANRTYAAPAFESALARLGGRDGYAIMTEPGRHDRLYVFGAMDKGTMNGLFALLENNTDIIWARPDETVGTVFGASPGELTFVWGRDVLSVPATRGRGWNGYRDVAWMAHNRCNMFNAGGGGDIAYMNRMKSAYGVLYTRHMGGHNVGIFVRDKSIKGQDMHDGNPCFTCPRVQAAITSNLLHVARLAPETTDKIYFNLHDTWTMCGCDRCLEPIRLPDGVVLKNTDEAFRSTQFWMFMNAVGREFAKEFPRMSIVALAYFPTAPAPACDLEPNVHPEFAPYVRVNDKTPITAAENRSWLRRLADWRGRAAEIEVYEYYGLGTAFPRPLAEVRARDFTVMHPFVLGMSTEYSHNGDSPANDSPRRQWDVSAMEFWVMCRLYWDPSQDVEQLRKRFIRRAYREAAPEIERVYGAVREEFFRSGKTSTLGDAPLELAKTLLVATGRDKEIESLFAKALDRKDLHPKSRKLVEALKSRMMAQIEEARNLKNPLLTVPLLRPEGEVGFENAVWDKAVGIDGFTKMTKTRDVPSDHRTTARIFHDSDNLWVKVICGDPAIGELPVFKPRPGVKESVPEVDHIELFAVDPLADGVYYMFSLTSDGVYGDLKGYDGKWNGEWGRWTRRTSDGWEAVVRLPLATVNADNPKGNLLKFLICREYSPHGGKPREYSSWGGGRMHQTAAFGELKLMR